MIKRKLLDGSKADEYEFPIELKILTKCPAKWKLIDLETGEEYIGVDPVHRDKKNRHWKRTNGY